MTNPTLAGTTDAAGDFVLTLACPDRPGIVHAVTSFLMAHGGNIMESQQFGDQQAGRFFMRIDFEVATPTSAEALRESFAATAAEFEMDFELWSATAPYRTLIMVSKQLHCLNDLLFRHSTGDLQIDVVGVVSNHLDAEPLVKAHGLEFHHVPVTPDTKADAEARLMSLVEANGVHLTIRIDGELAGFADLRLTPLPRMGEVGYWLSGGAVGKGAMTRTVAVLVDLGFEHFALHRVQLRAATENVRSRAVAERLGMVFEGVLREAEELPKGFVDLAVYSVLAHEWPGSGAAIARAQAEPRDSR